MRVAIAAVTARGKQLKSGPAHELVREYTKRASGFAPTETVFFSSEPALLDGLDRASGRTRTHLVLMDSRGKSLESAGIAEHIRKIRDAGIQDLMFAIGPADGWSTVARSRADLVLSLGAITLPHELALAVLAEQIYRALTILAGHPYHSGH